MEKLASPSVVRHSLPEELRTSPPAALGAVRFSGCGSYRWWLQRLWRPDQPRLLFIGLNPSRGDARRDDPTLRRLVRFARDGGYGGLEVVNLFSAVASRPERLRSLAEPIGGRTDAWIRRRAGAPEIQAIWLGWGNRGAWWQRDRQVLALLCRAGRGKPWLMLGTTSRGQPRHPLYVPAAMPWQPWSPAAS